MSAEYVAAILPAVVIRVQQLNTSCFPSVPSSDLHLVEGLLDLVLKWIASIFTLLCRATVPYTAMVRRQDENVIYSDDAKSTVAIATALQPILLHSLTAKINPYMCTKLLTFINQTLCMNGLPEELPMIILSELFWAVITAVFTVPCLAVV